MEDSFLPNIIDEKTFNEEIGKGSTPRRGAESRAPWWQIFLSSSGGTALITVLLGGIVGTAITAVVQNFQKDREFQTAWMKTRGEQALSAYNDYLSKEQEIVKQSFELIGDTVSASDDLINVTTPEWDPKKVPGIDEQRHELIDNYNKKEVAWRTNHETLGLLMSYYHHGQKEVTDSWNKTQDSVTAYMDCASSRYLESLRKKESWSKDDACVDQRKDLRIHLRELNENIDKGRRFVWQGWDSLACQKGLLDEKTCASVLGDK
jgi:hypothetical protein